MSGGPGEAPKTGAEVGDELRRLVQRSFRGNVEFLQRASELSRAAAREARAEPLSADEVVKRLVRFNLDYYSLLTDYAQAFMGDVLALTERSLATSAASTSPSSPGGATVRAEGPAGSTARAAFIVENRSDAPVTLGLSAGDLRAGDRTLDATGLIRFDPAAPTVPPRGEATIVVVVKLTKEMEPGVEYRSTIRVSGTPDQEIELIVRAIAAEVEITTEAGAPAEAPPPSRRPPRRAGPAASTAAEKTPGPARGRSAAGPAGTKPRRGSRRGPPAGGADGDR